MNTANEYAGSHHGAPDLFKRDIRLLLDYQKWVRTVQNSGGPQYKDWVPGDIDMLKSRLFWRIRSGKEPLPAPPPCAYSCPWYELIEVPGPHDVFESIRTYETTDSFTCDHEVAYVAQCAYRIIDREQDALILQYNCYKFKAWNGTIPVTQTSYNAATNEPMRVNTVRPGGWIQYIGTI